MTFEYNEGTICLREFVFRVVCHILFIANKLEGRYQRQFLGYLRFDDPAIIPLLNHLYTHEWRWCFNYFMPSMKLIKKEREGSTIKKTHDLPLTPLERLFASKILRRKQTMQLLAHRSTMNAFLVFASLRTQIVHILHFARPEFPP